MRREQAEMLIDKLQAAYNSGLPEDTRAIYVDKLMTLPFATGTRRVDRLINTSRWMPKIAELMQPVDGEIEQQNVTMRDDWADSPECEFALYRQDRMVALDEPTYWQYLSNPAERARLEAAWRYEWLRTSNRPRRAG